MQLSAAQGSAARCGPLSGRAMRLVAACALHSHLPLRPLVLRHKAGQAGANLVAEVKALWMSTRTVLFSHRQSDCMLLVLHLLRCTRRQAGAPRCPRCSLAHLYKSASPTSLRSRTCFVSSSLKNPFGLVWVRLTCRIKITRRGRLRLSTWHLGVLPGAADASPNLQASPSGAGPTLPQRTLSFSSSGSAKKRRVAACTDKWQQCRAVSGL